MKKPLLTANDQRRAHWTEVRDAKAAVELLVKQGIRKAKLQPIDFYVSVFLVWYAPTRHARDTDGLYPMMKACLDALVKEKILIDDDYRYVHQSICGPIVIAPDDPRFELVIREVERPGDLP